MDVFQKSALAVIGGAAFGLALQVGTAKVAGDNAEKSAVALGIAGGGLMVASVATGIFSNANSAKVGAALALGVGVGLIGAIGFAGSMGEKESPGSTEMAPGPLPRIGDGKSDIHFRDPGSGKSINTPDIDPGMVIPPPKGNIDRGMVITGSDNWVAIDPKFVVPTLGGDPRVLLA